MTGDKFEELKASLLGNEGKGYDIYNQHWHHEDYIIAKGFYKECDKLAESVNGYQIILSVYDYRGKDYAKDDPCFRNRVGIEISIEVDSAIDSRLALRTSWTDSTTIEEIEDVAESFYKWVCSRNPLIDQYYEKIYQNLEQQVCQR